MPTMGKSQNGGCTLVRRPGERYFRRWVYVLKHERSFKGGVHDRVRETIQPIESVGAAVCDDGPGADARSWRSRSGTKIGIGSKTCAKTGRRQGPAASREDYSHKQRIVGVGETGRHDGYGEDYR